MNRRIVGAALCALALVTTQADTSWASVTPPTECSEPDLNGDIRLGPADLPTQGAVGFELRTYSRFGGLTADQFLARWWDPTLFGGSGGWRFPPFNGFRLGPDGEPQHTTMAVRAGQLLDRFGSEFGAFLAPAGSQYAQRALPPQSLNNVAAPAGCNYVFYKVLQAFNVDGGPIAPAFEQPGNGLQYFLVGALVPNAPAQLNVRWLIDNGYLGRCVVVVSRPFSC